MNLFIESLRQNNEDAIKYYSKIIALSVRNEIEDFHCKNLSDEQMKELNPLVRKGIYNALFVLINQHKDDFLMQYVNFLNKSLPDYWEDPELEEELEFKRLELETKKDVTFESNFLNSQFACENIYYNKMTGCIHLKNSFEFVDITSDPHKHRDKISRLLGKEGYKYQPGLFGYIKTTPYLF